MLIKIGLELNNEGRALAWALDFPGCFAYGQEGPDALLALPRALIEYEGWVNRQAGEQRLTLSNFDLRVVDTWQVFFMDDQYNLTDEGYAVNAWFKQDWKPLEPEEITRGLDLLRWTRADLLKTVGALSDAQLDRVHSDERWTIRGIVRHVGGAEWWYLDRLGLAEGSREVLPKEPFERLAWVRNRLNAALPDLAEKALVIGKKGEFWSPRKLLRRVLWHEIDHRLHILKLLQLDAGGVAPQD